MSIIILLLIVLLQPTGIADVEECVSIQKTISHEQATKEGWNMEECLKAFI